MPRPTVPLLVSEDQSKQIEQWLAALGTPQQVALRCRIVAAAGGGESEAAIAAALQVNRKTVRLWRDRFAAHGLQGLWDIAPGRGRKATYGPDRVQAVMDATLQSKPKGITPWSCRLLAENQGLSKATVSRFWRSHNLKPHRNKKFQAVAGSRIPGKTHRCGRPLLKSPRSGNRSVWGREEPDSSVRPHPARASFEEGPLWNHDS